ncbi:MAG: radical SAM protein [Clostridia bacterium]|nr:radical SAM protein [Clostridia bacterium]
MNRKERKFYKNNLNEVLHTTLNPYEPGVVRIHLVPAKYNPHRADPSLAILNGKDIIPINLAWTILLAIFIKNVNKYNGKEITMAQMKKVVTNTVNESLTIYRKPGRIELKNDIERMLSVFIDIAEGREPKEEIGQLSIGEYAKKMRAPHRMDLMISSMTKDGAWNCNQKCIHCYAAGQEKAETKELSTEEWKKIIDKCRKQCIPQLTFTGGEPTKREDLVELIEYSKWFVTRLNTNGVLLTKELCSQLYNASLDSIQVTFYSNNPEKHNTLVGAKNFEQTVQGIKNAIKANLSISINTPLCTINKDYVETLKYLKNLGVKYVTCSGLIVTGNATKEKSKETQLSKNELFEILEQAKKYADENLMEISFTSPGWLDEKQLKELNMEIPTCGACLSNMAITPDGEVVPCQSWLGKNASLGNMLKDSWKKIWNNPKCKKQRKYSSKSTGKCPLKKGGAKNE